MLKLTLWTTVICAAMAIPAFAGSGDTVCVTASGNGRSHAEAVREAIRTAVETTAGLLVSSASQVENYRLARDRILTSANAYCYRYQLLDSSAGANDVHFARVEACISTGLLLRDAIQPLSQDTMRGMPQIQNAAFEAQEASRRAADAIAVLADYWQRNCRRFVRCAFDSIGCGNIDPMAGAATLTAYYSLLLAPNFDRYLPAIAEMNKRAQRFSGRSYCAHFEIDFDMPGFIRAREPVSDSYTFFICTNNPCISTEDWMKAFPWYTQWPNGPLAMFPEYLTEFRRRVFGECDGNNTGAWIAFSNVRAGKRYYFAGRTPAFDIKDVEPEYFRTLEAISLREYRNTITIENVPLESAAHLRPEPKLSMWVLESIDSKVTRRFQVIDRNRDVDFAAGMSGL